MRNMRGKTFKLKEDVTLVSAKGNEALLDRKRRCYYNPNESAYFLLKLMEKGISYEELQDSLLSGIADLAKNILLDQDAFIEEAIRLNLIEVTGDTAVNGNVERKTEEKKCHQSLLIRNPSEATAVSVAPILPAVGPRISVPESV